jgi:hypothetical protein
MTLWCVNAFHLNQINQYCTGLKCASYSVTQVKTQLHENTMSKAERDKLTNLLVFDLITVVKCFIILASDVRSCLDNSCQV